MMFSYSPLANLTIYDYPPHEADILKTVLRGLSELQKHLPPFLFFDDKGVELFDRIKFQPEYYLSRLESEIFGRYASEILEATGTRLNVIEPAAGRCEKIQLLLEQTDAVHSYSAMEAQSTAFVDALKNIAEKHPLLKINGLCVNYLDEFKFPDALEAMADRRLIFFLGSTIGNFEPAFAKWLLRKFQTWLKNGDNNGGLLIGIDTPNKEESVLNKAYNDEAGVIRSFNFNILDHINNALRINIPKENFEHRAFYNKMLRRVELHLVCNKSFSLEIAGHPIFFAKDEYIHTENSYKYEPEEFIKMGKQSGFKRFQQWTDENQMYAIIFMGN